MARPLRTQYPGGWYHVTSRGNEQRAIFRDDRDRGHWCDTLGRMVEQFNVVIHAYVLMDNHYHLLLEVGEPNLSEALQWLNVSYAAWFNRRHNRAGHLFQGRFKSVAVEPSGWGWELTRYMHLNPIRTKRPGLGKAERQADRLGGVQPERSQVQARLAKLRAYRWSSYGGYLGTLKAAPWLTTGRILAMGKGTRAEARERYRLYVEQAIRQGLERTPWESLKEGMVLGSERFLARTLGTAAAGAKAPELNKRLWWRPTWEQTVQVVETAYGQTWEQFHNQHGNRGRDLVLYLGRSRGRLRLRQLAEAAGMGSEAAVNLAIKRYEATVRSSKVEANRLKDCIAHLNKIGETLNV